MTESDNKKWASPIVCYRAGFIDDLAYLAKEEMIAPSDARRILDKCKNLISQIEYHILLEMDHAKKEEESEEDAN